MACTECNRRKNNYYEEGNEFLDPYQDDVENLVEHYGPVMGWVNGYKRAEITIRTLELDTYSRSTLISRKIEKIAEINDVIERYKSEKKTTMKKILEKRIKSMIDKNAEYSGMLLEILKQKGIKI